MSKIDFLYVANCMSKYSQTEIDSVTDELKRDSSRICDEFKYNLVAYTNKKKDLETLFQLNKYQYKNQESIIGNSDTLKMIGQLFNDMLYWIVLSKSRRVNLIILENELNPSYDHMISAIHLTRSHPLRETHVIDPLYNNINHNKLRYMTFTDLDNPNSFTGYLYIVYIYCEDDPSETLRRGIILPQYLKNSYVLMSLFPVDTCLDEHRMIGNIVHRVSPKDMNKKYKYIITLSSMYSEPFKINYDIDQFFHIIYENPVNSSDAVVVG
jgi:hypothetical protein